MKNFIENIPLCFDCKHKCILKTQVESKDSKQIVTLKSYEYCESKNKIIDITKHINDCDEYIQENNKKEKTKEISLEEFKKINDKSEKKFCFKIEK